MKIGFLGLGKMGTAMALRLLAAGHELAVWYRSEARTEPLLREGAIAAAMPAERGCLQPPHAPQPGDSLAEVFAQARTAGLGQEDWAVGLYRMSQRGNATPLVR